SEFARFFTGTYLRALSWFWYKIMLGVMLVVTVVCAFIPLLNILAYEFAAVVGLIVSHFTAILVIREINLIRDSLSHRSPFSEGPHSRLVVWGVIRGAMASVGWLMLIPLAGMVILDLILSIRNCDPLTGFIFFITIPVISSIFAGAVAVFCSLVTPNRSRAGWLYFAILIVFLIRMLLRFGVGHTIGLHGPFIGTLNLPLYSQEANPDFGFLYSRLFVLIFSVFTVNLSILLACGKFQYYGFRNLFGNFRKVDSFMPELQTLVVTGVILIVGFYNMGPLGIEITRNYLEHELDGEIVTEHFIIRYPTGGEVEEDIERVAEHHEYYYWSIYNEIQTAPDGLIRTYIYPDRDTKTFLTGVGSSVYAKPWTGEIHVEYSRNNIRALKHELVHVISAPMGVPFFGSSLLVGYGEGIAEGLEWNTGNNLTY
ncbi:hypothetical protein KAU08_09730, partial [bacterium]|nr:hypothetical protein [bacterium]